MARWWAKAVDDAGKAVGDGWRKTVDETEPALGAFRFRLGRWIDGILFHLPAAALPIATLGFGLAIAAWLGLRLLRSDNASPTLEVETVSISALSDPEREIMKHLDVATSPLLPNAPPAQFAPANQPQFEEARLKLSGLDPARGAALGAPTPEGMSNPQHPGCPDPDTLDNVRTLLASADGGGSFSRGRINYHLGLLSLCAGNVDAASRFSKAASDFTDAANLGRINRRTVAQYRAASHYGLALARAGWPSNRDADLPPPAGKDSNVQNDRACRFADAEAALKDARLAAEGGSGNRRESRPTFLTFDPTVDGRDLLQFSTADILSARVWTLLRSANGGNCTRDGQPDAVAPQLNQVPPEMTLWLDDALSEQSTLRLPALAANAAVLALVAQSSGVAADGATPEQLAYAGNPDGVKTLHELYVGARLAPAQSDAWERLRAMAAIAGSSFANDRIDNTDAKTNLHDICSDKRFPRFKLSVADTEKLDRFACLSGMKKAMKDGQPGAFAARFETLASPAANLDDGFGAAARSLADAYRPTLEDAADRRRGLGEGRAAQELESIMTKGRLFGSSASRAWLRQAFGSNWVAWVALIALIFVALVTAMVRRHALHRVIAALSLGWHHQDRVTPTTATKS